VRLELLGDDGGRQSVTADYVIACDGASSEVREQVGIALEDLVFDEPWLVVDLLVNEEALGKLPQTAAQYCDPARPTTFIIGPRNHRRWEIMLLPGEDPQEAQKPERSGSSSRNGSRRTKQHCGGRPATVFHALVATEWRRGRVFLAGDAQRISSLPLSGRACARVCAIARISFGNSITSSRGSLCEALLDSYGEERGDHVRELTTRIKAIGQVICERDPQAARGARSAYPGGGRRGGSHHHPPGNRSALEERLVCRCR
jgi:3-(3-hydroxy-phenyl)propionate hydroxylase